MKNSWNVVAKGNCNDHNYRGEQDAKSQVPKGNPSKAVAATSGPSYLAGKNKTGKFVVETRPTTQKR